MNVNPKLSLLYISSVNLRWTHLEWVCEHLDRERFELSFLLLSSAQRPPYLEPYLTAQNIPFRRLDCGTTSSSFLQTVAAVRRHCRETSPDVVHTHIFFASLAGLAGAFLAGVPVRVNTRHHLRSKHGRAGRWLDRLTNALATRIIATCDLLRRQLVDAEGASPRKVAVVHLGIDLDRFRGAPAEEVRAIARKYNPGGGSPVIGVVARHVKSKGIQYIIPAFRRLLAQYPSAFLVLAYRFGHYQVELRRLLADVPEDRYVALEFEDNVFALYQTFDLVVHVPIAEELESFGLIYIEALAAGRPAIFTQAGVARELLVHGRNCWVVDYRDSEQIYDGMVRLLSDPELSRSLAHEGRRSVDPAFSAETMVRALERIYLDDLAATARRTRRTRRTRKHPPSPEPAREDAMAPGYYLSEHEAAAQGLSADGFLASCLHTKIWVRELRDIAPTPWPLRLGLRACGFSPPLRVGDCLQAYRLHHTAPETGFAAWLKTSRRLGLGSDEDGRNWLIHPVPGLQRDGHWVQLADSHFVLLAK